MGRPKVFSMAQMTPPNEDEFVEKRTSFEVLGKTYESRSYRAVSQARAEELIAQLPRDRYIGLLLGLATGLTIVGRHAMYPGSFSEADGVQRMRHVNEMMHGLIQQVFAVWREDDRRHYSPEEFCQSMYDKARRGGFERQFATDLARGLHSAFAPCPTPPSTFYVQSRSL
jgi:hypothetical protein